MKFNELINDEEILNALHDVEIEEPSEIQEKSIPVMVSNKDMIGQAQTGTGKTFAYGIPTVMKMDSTNKEVQALILCPTRELSLQVSNELLKLIKYKKDLSVATVYGGESYEKQIRALRKHPQIVVGTPGRIIDHMNRKTLSFAHLTSLVLDEADEMLKMGFQDDLETILKTTPQERQTSLFSATMPDFIKKVALKYQNSPEHIIVKKKTLTVEKIEQEVYFCKRESKIDLLVRLIDLYNFRSCIIFCNTKSKVDDLVTILQKNDYSVDGLHGDLKQMVRDRVMGSFRAGNINYLIATDVAARGIDISELEAIINFDLPMEDELYVHRIGRTGRAGATGLSISLATSSERRKVRLIEEFTKSKMEVKEIPTPEAIQANIQNGLYEKIKSNLDNEIKDNLYIINKLASDGVDPAKVINALIDISLKKYKKTYNTIFTVSASSSRDRDSRDGRSRYNDRGRDRDYKGHNDRNDRSRYNDKRRDSDSSRDFKPTRTKEYLTVHLNIGRKEMLRPQTLLDFLDKTATVKKGNVGDIEIKKEGTTLEITKPAFQYLVRLEGKSYQGTKIKVTKISS